MIDLLVLAATVAVLSPVWVPAAVLLRRANVEAAVAVAIFVAWAAILDLLFGLDNLRHALGFWDGWLF